MPDDAHRLIDISTPHAARRYDYFLGGKDNFAADRESADAALAVAPQLRTWAQENRFFMHRVTAFLARDAGIRQFLDVGTGIPTSPNLHEIVQGISPDARVVYVDNDPLVLAHARALLTSRAEGQTAYLDADLSDPAGILTSDEVTQTFDLTQPIGLSLIAVLHFFNDSRNPYEIVRQLVDSLASGSYLAISHNSWDYFDPEQRSTLEPAVSAEGGQPRSREAFTRFFDDLELVEPGVSLIHRWRRDDSSKLPMPEDKECSAYGAVARIP